MRVFERITVDGHEQVLYCYDKDTGLKSIIAIHSTILGPALGGCRMWAYATEDEALEDVLRLSQAMTYKAAVAGLDFGGGKAVIIGDPQRDKSPTLLRAYGRFVESLKGKYITTEDMGTNVRDIEIIKEETRFVTGTSMEKGGSGDPSPVTAYGVVQGIKACLEEVYDSIEIKGRKIVIQGIGNVGCNLAALLHKEGARLIVTDIYEERAKRTAKELGAICVLPDAIYDQECDIFSPCALGGILNNKTIPRLRCRIIAGAANNQLLEERDSELLYEKGILYAPDYVINAGGLINVTEELKGYKRENALAKTNRIYDIILEVFAIYKRDRIPPQMAANRMAEERLKRSRQ